MTDVVSISVPRQVVAQTVAQYAITGGQAGPLGAPGPIGPPGPTIVLNALDYISDPTQKAAILNYTSTYDCTAALQSGINASIYNNSANQTNGLKIKVRIPAGKWIISNVVSLGYGTSYTSIIVEGDGYTFDSSGTFCGTCIIATHNNAPAFNIQGGRGSEILGLAIFGQNQNWIVSHSLGASGSGAFDDVIGANWVDPSFPASSSSRYAPYAAITIDAYSGVAPAVAYPNVNYPAFLGAVSQYGKNTSSDCLIQDVLICGFVAGVVNQPCDYDANGDFTKLRRVKITCCQYGISVGNSQSRNFQLDGVDMLYVHTPLTSNTHGRQVGSFNGMINDLSLAQCIQLGNFCTTAYTGPLTFMNCYAEGLYRLGTIASTSVENSIIFQSSKFNFSGQVTTPGGRGVPANVIDGANQNIDICFKGCSFEVYPSVVSFYQLGVRFDGCKLLPTQRSSGSVPNEYIGVAHNATCGGAITYQLAPTGDTNRLIFPQVNLDNLTIGSPAIAESLSSSLSAGSGWGRSYCCPAFVRLAGAVNDVFGDNTLIRPHTRVVVAKNSTTSASLLNKTLTFTLPSYFTSASITMLGFEVGDPVWDDQTGTTAFIRSRVGLTITAELQNNYTVGGTVSAPTYTPRTAISLTAGNWYSTNCRLYTPTYPLFGTTTTTSATITNAQRQDGYGGFITNDILGGDSLFIDDYKDRPFDSSGANVVSVSTTGGNTITLGGNAIYAWTFPQKRFAWWVRKAAANS